MNRWNGAVIATAILWAGEVIAMAVLVAGTDYFLPLLINLAAGGAVNILIVANARPKAT
jgi:hypothetical protein